MQTELDDQLGCFGNTLNTDYRAKTRAISFDLLQPWPHLFSMSIDTNACDA